MSSWFLGALGGDVLSIDSSKTDKLNWRKPAVFGSDHIVYAVVSNEDYIIVGGGVSTIKVFSARDDDHPLLWSIETVFNDEEERSNSSNSNSDEESYDDLGMSNLVLFLALLSNAATAKDGGPLLLVGGSNYQVQLWRLTPPAVGSAASAQRPLCIFDHNDCVTTVSFCPDGQSFLSGTSDGSDGRVKLWSFVSDDGRVFDDGKMRHDSLFTFHHYNVTAATMGHTFAAVVDNWGLILLHPETGLILDKLQLSRLGPVVVMSRDERFVLLGTDDGKVIAYDVRERAVVSTVKIPSRCEITAMRALDDAHSVAVCCGASVFVVFPAVGRVTRVFSDSDDGASYNAIAF